MRPISNVILVDARGLEPPEPFERVIDALARLQPEEEVLLLLDRAPVPLYRFLHANAYEYTSASFPDGRVEVRIRDRSAPGVARGEAER